MPPTTTPATAIITTSRRHMGLRQHSKSPLLRNWRASSRRAPALRSTSHATSIRHFFDKKLTLVSPHRKTRAVSDGRVSSLAVVRQGGLGRPCLGLFPLRCPHGCRPPLRARSTPQGAQTLQLIRIGPNQPHRG